MQRCYEGESFELRFRIKDCNDETRVVDSATMDDIGPDGTTLSSAIMTVSEDGHTVSARFTASQVGMHRLVVSWRMGSDAWTQPHLLQVEGPSR